MAKGAAARRAARRAKMTGRINDPALHPQGQLVRHRSALHPQGQLVRHRSALHPQGQLVRRQLTEGTVEDFTPLDTIIAISDHNHFGSNPSTMSHMDSLPTCVLEQITCCFSWRETLIWPRLGSPALRCVLAPRQILWARRLSLSVGRWWGRPDPPLQ